MISAIGSPRVAASASSRSAGLNPGSLSSSFFRPAPARRARPGIGSAPSASSPAPAVTVARDTPAAAATTATAAASPHPSPAAYPRASDPRYSRHVRSPICGLISAYLPASTVTAESSEPIMQSCSSDPTTSHK